MNDIDFEKFTFQYLNSLNVYQLLDLRNVLILKKEIKILVKKNF